MVLWLTKDNSSFLGLGKFGLLKLGASTILSGDLNIDAAALPRTFQVVRAPEGPQLVISWDVPSQGGPYTVRLERSAWTYPGRIYDGELIYQGTLEDRHVVLDRDGLKDCQAYHYTLFLQDTSQSPAISWYTHSSLQASGVALQTGYFKDKLFNLLPSINRIMDARPDLAGLFGQEYLTEVTLTLEQDGIDAVFNFAENSIKKQGQLQRFMKFWGLMFDEVRGLVRNMRNLRKIDFIEGRLLRFLASNVGLRLNTELSLARQRKELENYVHFHKFKGTEEGFRTQLKAITGNGSVAIIQTRDGLLCTSKISKVHGVMGIGRDLVGPNVNDPLGAEITAYTSSPPSGPSDDLTAREAPREIQRSRALLFRGGDGDTGLGEPNSAGFLLYAVDGFLAGSDPSNGLSQRMHLAKPGGFTVEFWVKFKRFPVYTATDVPVSDPDVTSGLTYFTLNFGDPHFLYRFSAKTHVDTVTGAISRVLRVSHGREGDLVTLFALNLNEDEIGIDKSFHVALTKRINEGPGQIGGIKATESPDYGGNDPADLATWVLYVNGEEVETRETKWIETDATAAITPFSSQLLNVVADGFYVGDLNPDSNGIQWVVDEYRVWDRVRTATEIEQHYQGIVDGNEQGLVVYSNFNGEGLLDVDETNMANLQLNQVVDLSMPASRRFVDANGIAAKWDTGAGYEGIYAYPVHTAAGQFGPAAFVHGLMPDPFEQDYFFDDEIRRRSRLTYLREAWTLSEDLHPKKIMVSVHSREDLPVEAMTAE